MIINIDLYVIVGKFIIGALVFLILILELIYLKDRESASVYSYLVLYITLLYVFYLIVLIGLLIDIF